ncbi:hypothetical protein K439DRAFT_1352466 [Ramaria rubella]|nr:hypothetical protein K439DRAFT_1352466 [Ramaria rubella]
MVPPAFWHAVIDAQRCDTAVEFQAAIKYHEESLSNAPFTASESLERRLKNLESPYQDARSHLVGWSSKLEPPKHPKDDSNVSSRATPEQKGARGCKYCGSCKHWDNEGKYSKSDTRKARSHHVIHDDEAQQAYDDLCQNSDEESESEFVKNAHAKFYFF